MPGRRLGLSLWAAGMVGVIAITATVLPQLSGQMRMPAPLWLLQIASLAQGAVLLALAVWAGVALAPTVGLSAPACEAAVDGRPVGPVLRPQLLPGLVTGVLGGMLLFAGGRYAPAALAEASVQFDVLLVARLLYGGITEELLLRWGLMTTLAWSAWRFLQHRRGPVQASLVWLAIAVSALLFAAGHLPAASALIGHLDANVIAFVVGWNTAFGLLFGYLFWRYGLESAIIAHASAHLVSFLASLL